MVRISRLIVPGAILAAVAGGANAREAPSDCRDMLRNMAGPKAARAMTAEDLARLRDIGPVSAAGSGYPLFAISPDHRLAAFQLRQADPARNRYCLAMVVVELANREARIVDAGGEPILVHHDLRGAADIPTGMLRTIAPLWSADGRSIVYLRRERGVTRIWRAAANGSGTRPLTGPSLDVTDIGMTADGKALVFSTRGSLERARAAIEAEGRTGFHYDDRFVPAFARRPFPRPPDQDDIRLLDLDSGTVRQATADEARLIGRWRGVPATRGQAAIALDQHRAWIRPTTVRNEGEVVVENPAGERIACIGQGCSGDLSRLIWMADGALLIFRREGWGHSRNAIYRWRPGRGAPRRIHVTDDMLPDCQSLGTDLLCLREGSLTPRRLERFNPVSGRRRTLFDPNPQISQLRLGETQRLYWTNAAGLEVYGDLVLPIGHVQGRRYPLVVVQYDTRGFLRGGTGDEYPIQVFAARGYAVLSISRPIAWGAHLGETSEQAVGRANLAGFAERRSLLSAIEAGVHLVVARGIADPARIGITGLSDGASSAAFALIHSRIFSAAAISSCCMDTTLPTRVGPGAARYFHSVGYPRLTDEGRAFWQSLSIACNAARIRTPLLLQLADSEYMSALESFTALREVGAPADMFVFPEEHHVKWQPSHRLAIYERALDWFDYWLLDRRSSAPVRQSELVHWDALRAEAMRRTATADDDPMRAQPPSQ